MQKKRRTSGFTMAELLIVTAIIVILCAVGFIAVQNHQRSLALLERDAIAKEIFIAAQNHLTMAESQGYLSKDGTLFGEDGVRLPDDESDRIYYVVNTDSRFDGNFNYVLSQMLPFGSVDETVRRGGRYLIRYQANPARVLDVFYWTTDKRFGDSSASYTDSGLMEFRYDRNKRRKNKPIIGWYGDEDAIGNGDVLLAPTITVKNAERLTVDITPPETYDPLSGEKIKLILTGVTSGAKAAIPIDHSARRDNRASGVYRLIIDDITRPNLHFSDLNLPQDDIDLQGVFIPGENVTFQAVIYNNSALTNIAYSSEVTSNSLFADIEDDAAVTAGASAMIGNFRHLENLDSHVSRVNIDPMDYSLSITGAEGELTITGAQQIADLAKPAEDGGGPVTTLPTDEEGTNDDLSWEGFCKEIQSVNGTSEINVYRSDNSTKTKGDCYLPVSPDYALTYEGNHHSISGVKADESGEAGLFGKPTQALIVSDLKLVDFSISATGSAGALAGSLPKGSSVTNVLACRAPAGDGDAAAEAAPDIASSEGAAGGLIGEMQGTTVDKSAAALTVSGKTHAGGLIGAASAAPAGGGEPARDSAVSASFAGGRTDAHEYYNHAADGSRTTAIYNVTASEGVAGGLIGDAGSTAIDYSYATCSASGATVGGLAGSAGGSIQHSYATGLVLGKASGSDPAVEGALIGELKAAGSLSDCLYYEIINERLITGEDAASSGYEYLPALGSGTSSGVSALDATAATYNAFVGAPAGWIKAEDADGNSTTCDATLTDLFDGSYSLKTVAQLGASGVLTAETTDDSGKVTPADFVAIHYGDWPAPETLVVNTGSGSGTTSTTP